MEQDTNQGVQNTPETQPQPAVAAPGVAQNSSPLQPLQPKKSKKGLLIAVVVTVLALVGIGAAGAYTYMNNKPEKVLADALTNTVSDILEKKPSSTIGSVTFESKGSTPAKVVVTFDSKSTGENGQGSADVKVSFAGKTYSIKASSVVIGEDEFYFKVENLKKTVATLSADQPQFDMYASALDPIIAKLDNQWIKVTKDDLKQFGMADEQKVDKCTAAVQNLSLSADDKKQLKKLFSENQFIIASETLKTEKAADESSFHYKLDFNDKAAEKFAVQVIELPSFQTIKKDCEINQKEIEGSLKNESVSGDDNVKPVVELWVGKKSRRPTKFSITANDKEFALDFNTEVKLNAKDVTIEKPAKSISIEELKSEFEKLYSSSSTNTSGMDNL